MPAPFRILHSFTVHLDKPVTETVVREENGQKITTEKTVTKAVPYEILLKEPSRSEKTALALFKDVTYGEAIKLGLIPKLQMAQLLGKGDASNPLSQEEDKALAALNRRMTDLANEHVRLSSPTLSGEETAESAQRKADIAQEWLTLQQKAIGLISAYQSVYSSTAEHYTQNKMLIWLELFLTYVRDPEHVSDSVPRPMFIGTDYAAKDVALGDMEDAKDPLLFKVLEDDRLPSLWRAYLYGRAEDAAAFKVLEEDWENDRKLRVDAEAKVKEAASQATAPEVWSAPPVMPADDKEPEAPIVA